MFDVFAVLVLIGIVPGLVSLWRHRTGTLAKGIGAAGISYNEFYGQGRPPEIVKVAEADDRSPDPRFTH